MNPPSRSVVKFGIKENIFTFDGGGSSCEFLLKLQITKVYIYIIA